ncbi:hypothetical protein L1285_16880 [Pseudoalteromonas sp. DL2-H2.2]|uniref:hypothetical protein n=1 Tax=Pseudoalteromonas sp. DL2-H2.2 TaxID=2908889 RepID=UPI001F1C4A34|nr:hypothetical protein [Pseudoalteromonas sp. DL2-H2.2]MCF2909997.1 hypothetical protein [Pseudoalteromonas sp. DL2-H2.2]
MITLAPPIKEQQLKALGDQVAMVVLFSGSAPSGAGELTDQEMLVEIPTPAPAYTEYANARLVMAATEAAMVTRSGVVGFARLFDAQGLALGDISVGGPASNADLKFTHESAQVYAGALVRLGSWSIG